MAMPRGLIWMMLAAIIGLGESAVEVDSSVDAGKDKENDEDEVPVDSKDNYKPPAGNGDDANEDDDSLIEVDASNEVEYLDEDDEENEDDKENEEGEEVEEFTQPVDYKALFDGAKEKEQAYKKKLEEMDKGRRLSGGRTFCKDLVEVAKLRVKFHEAVDRFFAAKPPLSASVGWFTEYFNKVAAQREREEAEKQLLKYKELLKQAEEDWDSQEKNEKKLTNALEYSQKYLVQWVLFLKKQISTCYTQIDEFWKPYSQLYKLVG